MISTALPAGISWDRSKGGSDNNDAPSAEYSRECSPRQAVPATFELVLTDYPARRKLALLTQDLIALGLDALRRPYARLQPLKLGSAERAHERHRSVRARA